MGAGRRRVAGERRNLWDLVVEAQVKACLHANVIYSDFGPKGPLTITLP